MGKTQTMSTQHASEKETSEKETCSLCSTFSKHKNQWIQCDVCRKWYHTFCLELPEKKVQQIISYHCAECSELHGPSELKRHSKRQRTGRSVDYVELNSTGQHVQKNTHPHLKAFDALFAKLDREVYSMEGDEISRFLASGAAPKPIKVLSRDRSGFHAPASLSVDEVAGILGGDHKVQVMDALSQQNTHWSMDKWNKYYSWTLPEDRDRIRNVISLEVEDTAMDSMIEIPRFVMEVSAIRNNHPKTLKYVLMSVGNAYTDFHMDYAGTCVYYALIRGSKRFMMFPPSEYNLGKYKEWVRSGIQDEWFLGDTLEHGIGMELAAGDLIMLPAGWIHSVYTPTDSLVVGGNFLTLYDMPVHLASVGIERELKVEQRFSFPNFNKNLWAALQECYDRYSELNVGEKIGAGSICSYLTASRREERDLLDKMTIRLLGDRVMDPKSKVKRERDDVIDDAIKAALVSYK